MTKPSLGLFIIADQHLDMRLDAARRFNISTAHLLAPLPQARVADNAKTFLNAFEDAGVDITVVFCQFKGESYADIPAVEQTVGLVPAQTRAERIAEAKSISDFAAEMGVKVTALHLGFIPRDRHHLHYAELVKVTAELCDHCMANDQALHLETGQEDVDTLLRFISDVDRKNLAINFDPANMILYGVAQPIPALQQLGERVKSVHCKDAVWSDAPGEKFGQEVPLGEGDVGMEAFVATLKEMDYHHPFTIEREIVGKKQIEDVGHGVALLDSLLTAYYP